MTELKKSYKAYSLLENIEQKFGASEFGRICQALLALSFKESGYHTTVRFTGIQDIRAKKNSYIYVIEAKAPLGNYVSIKKKDLSSIECGNEQQPIFAVLLYEIKPRWILLNARLLRPGQFRKISLGTFSIGQLEKEINPIFLGVVKKYYDVTVEGGVTSLINILR